MKKYVGAKAVRCGCYYCKTCLIQREILYFYNSEVTAIEARNLGLSCAYCKEALYTLKADKRQIKA